ncbi:hypothetical protein CFK38_08475 [Brachybacterium vulturis]|uniref:Uncharacterized protein n=1 Tax=Brachybacterium vulturis TaxID=2017484 RepID=A0A291GMV6_9MICO|nr:DUF6541 family protein [Brachybacterium vulturis]ATG51555.1 hypothetical protein CFK38_08475 [Brachybacterium vulturis]
MSDALALPVSGAAVLVLLMAPGTAAVRVLRGSWLLALALAPSLGLALAGLASLLAGLLGVRWSLLPWTAAAALLVLGALGLRRLGARMPSTLLGGRLMPPRAVPLAPLWVACAAAIAIIPIMHAAGWRPDAVLERWDTLYHLSALQWVRESGSASPLTLGAISNSSRTASLYPSAFHALASLVPGVPVPVLLNGSVLVLSTVPWIMGIALLARAVLPQTPWAPAAGAVLAALIPGAPVNEWIHLSPIPNLVGFAALPGLLAAGVAMWTALLRTATVRTVLTASLAVGVGGLGLLMTHPNTAVMALLLLTVLTAPDALHRAGRHPMLTLIPVALLVPVAMLQFTPLGGMVTEFSGGLQVAWWTALGEVVLGLHTVWPMALGVVLALAWWPGVVLSWRNGPRWLVAAWALVTLLYLDAAVDSPLDLSVLFYRGQDRLTMPLAMLSCLLAIVGLRWWGRLLRAPSASVRQPAWTRFTALALALIAVLATLGSIPTRAENASRNLALDHPGRGRFLQADELAAWERAAPTMDMSEKVLASPFSGASHMWALHGQSVHFAVAGGSLGHRDELIMQAARDAPTEPTACAFLMRWGIGYVYQDRISYQYDARYAPLDADLTGIGPVVFSTPHSTLYEVRCDPGDGGTDYVP